MKNLYLIPAVLLSILFSLAIASAYSYDSYSHTSFKETTPYSSITESKTILSNKAYYSYKSDYYYPYRYNKLYTYFQYGPYPDYYSTTEFRTVTKYPKPAYYYPGFSKPYYPYPPYYYGPQGSLLKPEYNVPSYGSRVYSQKYIPYHW